MKVLNERLPLLFIAHAEKNTFEVLYGRSHCKIGTCYQIILNYFSGGKKRILRKFRLLLCLFLLF